MPPPDLAAIEAALITDIPLRVIASAYAMTPAALRRHRTGHMARADAAEPWKPFRLRPDNPNGVTSTRPSARAKAAAGLDWRLPRCPAR